MNKRTLMNKLMKIAYGLGVVFLMTGMLLSAINVPAMAQEETPAAPTEEVVVTEEVVPTEPVDLILEGPAEPTPTEEPTQEPAIEATVEPTEVALTLGCVYTAEDGSLMAVLSDESELPVVDGFVQGTEIVVGADAVQCETLESTEETIDGAMCHTQNFTIDCTSSSIQFVGDSSKYGQVEAKFFKDGVQVGSTQTASWNKNGNVTFNFSAMVTGDGNYYWQIRHRMRNYSNSSWGSWSTSTTNTEHLVCTPIPDPATVSNSINCDGATLTIDNPGTGANITVSYSLKVKQGNRWNTVEGTETTLSLAPGNSETASYNNLDFTKKYKWVWSIDGEAGEGSVVDMSGLDCWDKSSLSFTAGCTGDCETISATVCNTGDGDMDGSTSWYLWYAETGNPKDGSQIASGTIPALSSDACYDISMAPINGDGNYMFSADQRPYHPGTGELWSGQCEISCTVPDVPVLTVTGECDQTNMRNPYKYTVNFSNMPEGTQFFLVDGGFWTALDGDGYISDGYTFNSNKTNVHIVAGYWDGWWIFAEWITVAEADGEASCDLPEPEVSVAGECNQDAGFSGDYKYVVSYSNLPSGSYLYNGDTLLTGPVAGTGTYTFYSDQTPVTVYAMNADCKPSDTADLSLSQPELDGADCIFICEVLASDTSDTLVCTNPDLPSAAGTCGWNMDPAVAANPYAFTYVINYTDMPADGLLTLEYGSPYPTQSVTGSGIATFTVYAASDPGSLRVSASGAGIANLYTMTSLSNTCPVASLTASVDNCVVGIDNYLYNYIISPSNVPNGATITYSGPVSVAYAGGNINVDNSALTSLSASATLPNGVEIASGSAGVTADDTLKCGPSITVDGTCRDDLSGNPIEYTFNATGTNLFGGSILTDGGAGFPITQTGPTVTAVWSLDSRVYDEFTADEAAALTCTASSLTVEGTGCALSDGGLTLVYSYSVSYSGYKMGDEFKVGDVVVGTADEDGAGSFIFTSSENSNVVVSSVLGNSTPANADISGCPAPVVQITGQCVANEAGTGYLFNYNVAYADLVGPSEIIYSNNGSQFDALSITNTLPHTGTDSLVELTYAEVTASWSVPFTRVVEFQPTVTATATIDMQTCPVLDLTVENSACALETDTSNGHVNYVWTVTNPGANPVPFTWTSTSGESGSGIVMAYNTTTFKTRKPETTSVTVYWGEELAEVFDTANVALNGGAGSGEVTAYPSTDIACADMQGLLIQEPYCRLNDAEEWEMSWTIENPNDWTVGFSYKVNNGSLQGPIEMTANGAVSIVTPLGENKVEIFWDGGNASQSSIDALTIAMCEGTSYKEPPSVPEQLIIPVTGSEPILEAPAAGGELLIPVTGADLNTPDLGNGFFNSLFTYMGLFFLGIGMVMQGVKSRLPK